MSEAAERALVRLFERGENARSRDREALPTLAMTPAGCPEYAGLESWDAFERFHARIALAERSGAIAVERERGGERMRLLRLRLLDLDCLGHELDRRLRRDRVGEATTMLQPWLAEHPVLAQVLQRWSLGKAVHGNGPDAATALRDAAIALASRHANGHDERILRRESVRLFGDSKRLEAITPWLELLITGETGPSGLGVDDVWAAVGLRKTPQPVLIAGRGQVRIGDVELPLCRPYLGLPADAVQAIDCHPRYLLTIENLTSFHDAARVLDGGDGEGLLVYTAGMPSPTWRALYRRLLDHLPAETHVLHWGDIDEGGFRIAAQLAELARAAGRRLDPWRMSPDVIPADAPRRATPNKATLERMCRWATAAGWPELAERLRHNPLRLEQEALDAILP